MIVHPTQLSSMSFLELKEIVRQAISKVVRHNLKKCSVVRRKLNGVEELLRIRNKTFEGTLP